MNVSSDWNWPPNNVLEEKTMVANAIVECELLSGRQRNRALAKTGNLRLPTP